MKKLIFMFSVLVGSAVAQQFPAYQLFINVNGVPTAVTSTLTTGQIPTPPAILAKCVNGGIIVDCNFSGGGGSISLTTTGTSGAATLTGTVLNIPIYSGGSGALFPGSNGIVFNTSTTASRNATPEDVTAILPCPLENATNICVTRPPYNADPTGVVDASSAFNAAITALASSGGTIWVPNGTYNLNGPLLDPTGANAILPMPKIQSNTQPFVLIQIKGLNKPTWGTATGSILQTTATTGNLIGGFNNTSPAGGTYPPFTNVGLNLDNLTFIVPTNPGITVVNATRLIKLGATHLVIQTVAQTVPSNTASVGIAMPSLANNVENYIDDVNVVGFYNGYIIGEHTHIGAGYAGNNVNGFVFDVGFTTAVGSHHNSNSISADYLWCQGCTNVIASGAEITTLHISEVDMEVTTGNGVLDAGNLLRGVINFNVTVPSGSTGYCNANQSGATFVTLNAMQCQGGVRLSSTLAGGFGSAVNFMQSGTSFTPNAALSNPSAGVVSIDATPGDGLGIIHALNGVFAGPVTGGALTSFQNTNGCVGCYTGLKVMSDATSSNFFGLYSLPANWTVSGLLKPLMAYLGAEAHNTNGLAITTETTAPFVLGTNNTARLTIDGTTGAMSTTGGVLPSVDPAITVGQAVCIKSAGPPLVLGKCTSVVGAGGACTCS